MANTVIQLKYSATPSAIPANLANGEIALNYADGRFYYKNLTGQIVSFSGSSNVYSFATINANNSLITALSNNSVLTINPGDNIGITPDIINDIITISANLSPANNWANTKLSNGTVTLAGELTTTGEIFANSQITIYPTSGEDEGGEIQLWGASSYPDWSIDSYQNQLRFFTGNSGTQQVNFFNAVGGSLRMGINTASPSYAVDVTGDINVTGEFRVNGTPLATGTVDLTAANNWANTVSVYANNYAGAMSNSVNAYTSATYSTLTQLGQNWAVTNAAFDIANNAYTATNGAAAFAFANGVAVNAAAAFAAGNAEFTFSNTIYAAVNSAFGVINAAFGFANSSNTWVNSTFVKLTAPSQTITGDFSITGNLIIGGNTTSISANNLVVNDSLIYLANNNQADILDIGFIGSYKNATSAHVHTGLYREHASKQYYLFQGFDADLELINDIVPYANNMVNATLIADFSTSNLTLGGANAITWITSGFNVANAAFGVANNAYTATNGAAAFAFANGVATNTTAAFAATNAEYTFSNTIYAAVNSAFGVINASFGVSNSAFNKANSANVIASAAFDKANSSGGGLSVNVGPSAPSLPNVGNMWWDTITGRLFIYYTDIDSSQWVEASPAASIIDYETLTTPIFNKANSANVLAFNTGIGANNYAGAMANASNAYAASLTPDLSPAFNKANSANVIASAAFARGNTSAQLAFYRVTANGSNLDAASNSDTLTISSSNNIILIANSTNDSLQITQSPSGVFATTYGGSSHIPVIVVDAFGRITSAANQAIITVSSVSGVFGRTTSSGGSAPTIDLATTGAGAATYSTGISAITVDAYGRVTSVTGSAGYATAASPTFTGTVNQNANTAFQTLTDGATINWDVSLGQIATVTLGGNRTIAAPTNLKVGTYLLHVIQDATGSRTLTWNAVFKWPAAVAPTLTTTESRRDIISFVCDGTNLYGSFLPDVR